MRILLVAASGLIALAGCGSTSIDTHKAEGFIKTTVVTQVGAHVKSVSCPSSETAKKGASFTCTVTGTDGSKGAALVTERDDKGNVHVSAPFVHTREIEASIATGLAKKIKTRVRVACPEIITAQANAKFNCTATDPHGDKARVEAIQKDAKGNVRYHVVPLTGAK